MWISIKLILGIGTSLENRMIRMSGLDMKIHFLKLVPNPDCKICGRT